MNHVRDQNNSLLINNYMLVNMQHLFVGILFPLTFIHSISRLYKLMESSAYLGKTKLQRILEQS